MTVSYDEFQQFFVNIATTRKLLEEANNKDALIEGTILYASIIDALLRQLILMERSIKAGGSVDVPAGFVWQHEGDKMYSERQIIKIANDESAIDRDIFNELNFLYDERNKIVHRYILSWYKYSDIVTILDRYEKVYRIIFTRIEKYEQPDLHKLLEPEKIGIWDRIKKKL